MSTESTNRPPQLDRQRVPHHTLLERVHDLFSSRQSLKQIRRVVVAVIGSTVLLIGIALLVLPGPAILVIPAGLAILGLEFRWARRWLHRAKGLLTRDSPKPQ